MTFNLYDTRWALTKQEARQEENHAARMAARCAHAALVGLRSPAHLPRSTSRTTALAPLPEHPPRRSTEAD